MEQVKNSMTLDILQTMAAQNQLPKTESKANSDSDFQKMMDKAVAGSREAETEETPETEVPTQGKAEKGSAQEKGPVQEDPVETSKKLQVFLTPVPPSVLAQYPTEWLPQNLEEGEPVVCIGVRTGKNGEDIPILVGAREAARIYGRDDIVYVSDEKADAMLEMTAPGADSSPAALLEKVVDDRLGKVADDAVNDVVKDVANDAVKAAVRPEAAQKESDDTPPMEVIDARQAPQPLFHDVKAAPVKVGEVYDVPKTEEPDVVRQVDAGLAQALEKGESLVRIQLSPENLGSITVEITRSTEGVIHVALSAHSGETRNLLERHVGELQGLLSNRTQQSVEVNVQRQQESQQNQNHSYDGHNGHAQDGGQRRRQRQEQTGGQDFIQQLRLGLIPMDSE